MSQTSTADADNSTITRTLLTSRNGEEYISATQHEFLKAAGRKTLSAEQLSLWLSQDHEYAAHAYPRFIGALIAKIPLSSHYEPDSLQEARHQRVLALLTYALQNIVREANFFRDCHTKHGLDIFNWKERQETRNYTAEMARVASQYTLEEGIVFLWAMEKVYLDAWTFVKNTSQDSSMKEKNPRVWAAIEEFVENWTNDEFVSFVESLGKLVDELYSPKVNFDMMMRAQAIWERVIELEIGFWPDIREEELERHRKAV